MKNRIKDRILPGGGIISVATAFAMLIGTGPPALADTEGDADGTGYFANTGLITPPLVLNRPYGLSYAHWAAKYWQWTLAFPANADPASGTAPQESGQSGPVWFLAGAHSTSLHNPSLKRRMPATVTRQIRVPEGKSLFFSVLSVFDDNTGCPTSNNPELTARELAARVQDIWNATAVETYCLIDGVPVKGLENPLNSPYLIQTPSFRYTLAAYNNLLAAAFGEPCVPDGTTVAPAFAEGIFLMVPPLPVRGTPHTIQFGAVAGPLAKRSFAAPPAKPLFVSDIIYNITVTPSTVPSN